MLLDVVVAGAGGEQTKNRKKIRKNHKNEKWEQKRKQKIQTHRNGHEKANKGKQNARKVEGKENHHKT